MYYFTENCIFLDVVLPPLKWFYTKSQRDEQIVNTEYTSLQFTLICHKSPYSLNLRTYPLKVPLHVRKRTKKVGTRLIAKMESYC